MNEKARGVFFRHRSAKMRTSAVMHDVYASLKPVSCFVVDEVINEGLVTFVVDGTLLKVVKYESQVVVDCHYQVDIGHPRTNDALPHRLADRCSTLGSSGK